MQQFTEILEILDYNDGRRVTHRVGRFVVDRYHRCNRWVRAMRQTRVPMRQMRVPMRFIDGPYDPNSGRHMAGRHAELIPDADVILRDSEIRHWPQIEDPEAVVTHLPAFIDGLPARP